MANNEFEDTGCMQSMKPERLGGEKNEGVGGKTNLSLYVSKTELHSLHYSSYSRPTMIRT